MPKCSLPHAHSKPSDLQNDSLGNTCSHAAFPKSLTSPPIIGINWGQATNGYCQHRLCGIWYSPPWTHLLPSPQIHVGWGLEVLGPSPNLCQEQNIMGQSSHIIEEYNYLKSKIVQQRRQYATFAELKQ